MTTRQPADPGDDGYTLLFDVWLLAGSTRAVIDGALRTSELTAEDFALYSVLKRDGGVTPSDLATMMVLPPTTVSSAVRRLERRGHVQRVPNPRDGRSYRIELTADGTAAHTRAAELFAPLLADIEARLGGSVGEFRAVLRAVDAAVRAAARP